MRPLLTSALLANLLRSKSSTTHIASAEQPFGSPLEWGVEILMHDNEDEGRWAWRKVRQYDTKGAGGFPTAFSDPLSRPASGVLAAVMIRVCL